MKRFAWRLAKCALGLVAWLCAGASQALCTLPLCTCTVSTTNVVFGNYDPMTSSNLDGVGSVFMNCGGVAGLLIPYTVDLSAGTGTFAQRRLASGTDRVAYNLYLDSTRTTVWGDGTGGSSRVSGSILLNALGLFPGNTHTVYGRLPALQTTAVPGRYADTITVTVTFQ